MRRFVTLALLLFAAIPFGVSISGCSKSVAVDYCNGQNSGVVVGQLTTLDLEPRLTGISLNQGQIGNISSPAGLDCKGTSAATGAVSYGTTDLTLVDVQPNTGRICAGTWNRQTGGGIPDYTVCTPTARSGTVYASASASGVSSNAIPIYVHPTVTSIVLGPGSTDCVNDPASNCYNTNTLNGQCLPTPIVAPACVPGAYVKGCTYVANSCLSQGQSAQLVARTFTGTNQTGLKNISCQVGPLVFGALNTSILSIDANGLATASQPGSSIISANASQASSSAGFFSTCPPQTITLNAIGQTGVPTAPISVNQNQQQTLTASVVDTQGNPITSLQLEYVSTTPTTIPAGGSIITPTYPGSAAITAICQPPTCNAAPFNEIGLFNNGTPVTSNPVQINATGTANSTVLYIASTNSLYVQPVDFTVTTQSAPVRLPYAPNSMVLSQDLSTIYMGSATELMVLSSGGTGLTLSRQDNSVVGPVLAVSPDNSTAVITDPNKSLVYLYSSSGTVSTQYGGTGVRASFSPDSQYVYITTTDGRMLVHSNFTGWNEVPLNAVANDVVVTVPSVGVYLAGNVVTARTNCPLATSTTGTGFQQTIVNSFYPQANTTTANADRLAATNDGVHILGAKAAGASAASFTDIKTNAKSGGCPVTFTSATGPAIPFVTAAPTTITGVLPTSDSTYALVTYQGTGGVVPQYTPASGTLTNVVLQKTTSGTPIAPVSGVVSSDNQTFYVGTSGDNVVHRLSRGTTGFTDTLTPVVPSLVGLSGGIATPDLLVQKPRKATN